MARIDIIFGVARSCLADQIVKDSIVALWRMELSHRDLIDMLIFVNM